MSSASTRICATAFTAALLAANSVGPAGAGVTAVPGYQVGPAGGDSSTFKEVDTASGTITILQHNSRQAGTVHCIGDGPRATLVGSHKVTDKVSRVAVDYTDAIMTEHPIIDVLVLGKNKKVLGHRAAFGPKYNESGTVAVPLFNTPAIGDTLRVLIGLQVHAGCLPHPFVLGLAGSRPLEGARVTFPSFSVS
ncbi:MAG: hypothetical protein ACT4P1_15160 [Sporichthyaceae bacterium]